MGNTADRQFADDVRSEKTKKKNLLEHLDAFFRVLDLPLLTRAWPQFLREPTLGQLSSQNTIRFANW